MIVTGHTAPKRRARTKQLKSNVVSFDTFEIHVDQLGCGELLLALSRGAHRRWSLPLDEIAKPARRRQNLN
jgi:hypothetical protein